jgi:hypothetical protein
MWSYMAIKYLKLKEFLASALIQTEDKYSGLPSPCNNIQCQKHQKSKTALNRNILQSNTSLFILFLPFSSIKLLPCRTRYCMGSIWWNWTLRTSINLVTGYCSWLELALKLPISNDRNGLECHRSINTCSYNCHIQRWWHIKGVSVVAGVLHDTWV